MFPFLYLPPIGGENGGGVLLVPFDCFHFPTGQLVTSYIVAAAVAYMFHCIRLEGYAKSTSAIKLAASKATTETMFEPAKYHWSYVVQPEQ